MAELHGAQLVIFLNTALSATCSTCTFLGLWPFGSSLATAGDDTAIGDANRGVVVAVHRKMVGQLLY